MRAPTLLALCLISISDLALAAPPTKPAESAIAFSRSEYRAITIGGSEQNPVLLTTLSVRCPQDGTIVLRAQAQVHIEDDGDRGTNAIFNIALNTNSIDWATEGVSMLGSIHGPFVQRPISVQRVEACAGGELRTYSFVAAQNDTTDVTIAERFSLVAEFFARSF